MIQFEQTFNNFLLQHQERHNRTYHFLILMDALISYAKHIQHYYLTGALKGNLGMAGDVNVQNEDVMRMDQIAQQIAIHYLTSSGRMIHAISEESKEIIQINPEGRYFIYFDPLDGSSNIPHGLPVGFLFGIAKRNLEGPEVGHLRAGKDDIAAGMFVIPTGTFTLALKDAGTWRFHINETINFVRPTRMMLPEDREARRTREREDQREEQGKDRGDGRHRAASRTARGGRHGRPTAGGPGGELRCAPSAFSALFWRFSRRPAASWGRTTCRRRWTLPPSTGTRRRTPGRRSTRNGGSSSEIPYWTG